jgi:predicted nucleic acid-binding protein
MMMRRTSVSETVLADTGYWIALFDPREAGHSRVARTEDLIELLTLIVPWPILYETLRTRFVRRRDWVARLDARLKRRNVVFIDDRDYCEEAYALSVEYSTHLARPISMVDMLCRLLIADPNVRIDYLLTINAADFHDVCIANRVQLL